MKKLKFLALLMIAITVFAACNKDDNDDNTEETGMSVEYDGKTWKSTTVAASYTETMDLIVITGLNSNTGQQLIISFTGSLPATHPISSSDESPSISLNLGLSGTFSTITTDNPTGEIVITKFDKEKKLISGTFRCKAAEFDGTEMEFTNGKFTNITYISQ
jgi:hypothetical protein